MESHRHQPVNRPAPAGALRRLTVALATGLGFGYSPVASGTAGALWGLVLAAGVAGLPGLPAQIAAAAVLTVLAVPLCGAAEAVFARRDDRRIVADEFLTFPLCMLGLPFTPAVCVVAFLTNRFFDIVKPPPANRLQEWPGGGGVVADDVVAALYSLAVNHLLVRLLGW